ncbi:MAG TPA: hypothetical protein VF151_10140 [Gemmatimonadales bacterium]
MAYTQLSPQPALRDPSATGIAPGLYPNEVAVNLTDINKDAAVFVEIRWLPNNQGAEFYASARYINADGSTCMCAFNEEIVTEVRHVCDPATIQTYGVPALSKEHVLLMLGEPATMVTITNPDNTTYQAPMIPWPDDFRANCSIRHAIAIAASAGEVTNLGSIL